MMNPENRQLSKEDFVFLNESGKLYDEVFQGKPIGFF